MRLDFNNPINTLACETIDAGNQRCPECSDTAPGDKLYVFTTVRGNGAVRRIHDGAFCSKDCHDVYHGLKARTKAT